MSKSSHFKMFRDGLPRSIASMGREALGLERDDYLSDECDDPREAAREAAARLMQLADGDDEITSDDLSAAVRSAMEFALRLQHEGDEDDPTSVASRRRNERGRVDLTETAMTRRGILPGQAGRTVSHFPRR